MCSPRSQKTACCLLSNHLPEEESTGESKDINWKQSAVWQHCQQVTAEFVDKLNKIIANTCKSKRGERRKGGQRENSYQHTAIASSDCCQTLLLMLIFCRKKVWQNDYLYDNLIVAISSFASHGNLLLSFTNLYLQNARMSY